jgi:hypothetical protein
VDPKFALRGWAVSRQNANSDLSPNSQGSISWDEGGLRKVKHVELKYHFMQHHIRSGQSKVTYVPSEDNCADGLTKTLAGSQFKKMRQELCVV